MYVQHKARAAKESSVASAGKLVLFSAFLLVLSLAGVAAAQLQFSGRDLGVHDTGVRGNSVDSGKPIAGLTSDQSRFFEDGKNRFLEIDSVSGTVSGESGSGLGPSFNGNRCAGCHSQPAVGGTSPNKDIYPFVGPNPQVPLATLDGATNVIPFFININGPVREARFKYAVNPDGSLSNTPDGGVHDLYTIQGRVDATNVSGVSGSPQTCQMKQPDFVRMQALRNLSLRIPTPVFGAGLIESIDDATILANQAEDAFLKRELGISGHPNRNGNDGTIARFGWKAQNKSLQLFSGEAYNVEMGVTNEVFPTERGYPPSAPPPSCLFNPSPEDATVFSASGSDTTKIPSDVVQFSTFMRFLDQPSPACTGSGCSPSIQNGRHLFVDVVKCAACHTPTMRTAASTFAPALNNIDANLFSDLLVHHIGPGLADGISQGGAGPDEFRTAPLWGLGQRIFFLHDGRTADLLDAIEQHAGPGSEANGVILMFHRLSPSQKQDLLNFLRSL